MQQQGLTILITNNTLAAPAGTECYVVTLARYLRDTGHFPIAYSTQHGAIAEKLKSLGVLVVNNLEALTIEPDIIHGHHHLDTACALARFPRTPAIAFNHGVVPWEEASFPPIERIYRYVTVSRVPTKRVYTEGITRERTAYLPNFVDADEFLADFRTKQQRTHGSPRALVYGNYPHKGLHLIESACRKQGFVLDMAGYAFGQTVSEPSALLPSYDLVFATGKAAMEALALTRAKEEMPHNIHVNIVAPGLVETDMGVRLARAMTGNREMDDLRALDASSPFGRVCQPLDVANVVLWLCSDGASYVTGQRIECDGGGPR